jgi:ketosteroid isomerase-like protein
LDEIRAAYKSLYDSPEKMGKFELKELEIDLLTESDALVVGTWSHTTGPIVRDGVFTVHMKKIGGEWVVVTDHTSTIV